MKILSNEINEFIKYCNDSQIDIYIVGGAIRDSFMNKETYDYDFALSSNYNHALSLLEKNYICKSDDKYQSIKINLGKYNIEITHCRKEDNYKDYRHPENIIFIDDIEIDSNRRDFTINSLYYKDGKIYDFHNGIDDINNKRLNVIGNINIRFNEDPLRILRMIRFSLLGFEISKENKEIINNSSDLLKKLSKESFYSEFDKLLDLDIVNVLKDYKLLFEKYFNLSFTNLEKLNQLTTINEKKTYLGIENNSFLYRYKDIIIQKDFKYLNKLIFKLNKEIVRELVSYYDKVNNDNIIDLFNQIIQTSITDRKSLNVTSKEVIDIIEEKEKTSYYINMVINAIIDGEITNNKDDIKKYLMENKQ